MIVLRQQLVDCLIRNNRRLYYNKATEGENILMDAMRSSRLKYNSRQQLQIYCLLNVFSALKAYLDRLSDSSPTVEAHQELTRSLASPLIALVRCLDSDEHHEFEELLIKTLSCNPPFNIFV